MIPEKYVLMQQGYADSIVNEEGVEQIIETPPDVQQIVQLVNQDLNNRMDLFELLCSEFPEVAKEVLNPDVYLVIGG